MSEAVMRRLAKPLLFLAAFIWGTSFFIMKNTLDAVPPFWLLVFRFTTGAVLLGLCWLLWRFKTPAECLPTPENIARLEALDRTRLNFYYQ